ncbi:MAG: CPBP family intramembrane glutamic endopeptidase [Bacteroidales bacterium]|jgi:membrane protease YdiL (CAAX protease family)
MKKIHKTWLFLIITFTASYSLAGLFYLFGGNFKGPYGTIMGALYMLIPMLSVLLIEKGIYKEKIKEPLRISFKLNLWFLAAILIPILLNILSMGISLLLPDISFSPEMAGMFKRFESSMTGEEVVEMKQSMEEMSIHPVFLTLIYGVLAGITVNGLFAFGEELGWRGFLLRAFKRLSFVKASLLIGGIWGLWHAPLILQGHNYPQHPVTGVFMMTAWCILLAFLFNYITLKAKSVIAAAIMHGVLNGTAGISLMLVEGGNDLIIGVSGVSGFIAILLTILGLFFYDYFISKEKIMLHSIDKSWIEA